MKQAPNVLIIEDDAWFADQLARVLRAAGFSSRHAANGIAGIKALDEQTPDAVVLDMFLPGPNALVLLHEMQSYVDLSKVPVILCTGSAVALPAKERTAYNIVAVLDKSTMQPGDIVAAVTRVLA